MISTLDENLILAKSVFPSRKRLPLQVHCRFAWGKGEAVTEGGGRVCNVTVEWAIPADAADGTYRVSE